MSGGYFRMSVPVEHPSLAGHFAGNPVVPGVLLLDEAMRALQDATGRAIVRLQQVKFVSSLRPGEVAYGSWELVDSRASLRLHVRRSAVLVLVAEGVATLSAGEER